MPCFREADMGWEDDVREMLTTPEERAAEARREAERTRRAKEEAIRELQKGLLEDLKRLQALVGDSELQNSPYLALRKGNAELRFLFDDAGVHISEEQGTPRFFPVEDKSTIRRQAEDAYRRFAQKIRR
jgi:hypothetical protein